MKRIALLFIGSILLAGCGGDDAVSSKVVGAWVLEHYSDAVILNDDGTAYYSHDSDGRPGRVRGSGTWKTKGGMIFIEVDDGWFEIGWIEFDAGETLEARYSMSGNSLTLTLEGESFIFVKVE